MCYYIPFNLFILRAVAIYLILIGVPIYFLHSAYYKENKAMVVRIDADGITIEKSNNIQRFPRENIQTIIVSKSAAMDKGGLPMTPFEYYFYAKIILKEGHSFYLTSLLDRKIDEKLTKLEGITFTREKGIFAFI
jgi:hypothetical protein